MKKFLSVLASVSLLINSLFAPLTAIAQEVSPTPEPTPTTIEETATAIAEATIDPTTEPTQESIPTETPVESVSPTPTVETLVLSTPMPTSEPVQSVELNAVILENTNSETVEEYDFSSNDYSSASLITDKADYAPTDTVLITGNGFIPNKEYGIEITSSTGNFKFSDKVTSDESGGLFYAYQLDGTYRPDYKVEIRDGNVVVSSVTFTDSPSCQNDVEGVNDEPGQKDLTRMCADYASLPTTLNIDWNWDDSAWSGGNTGDGCALFDTDADGDVNYAMCVTVGGSPASFISKQLYSCNDTKPDRCAGKLAIPSNVSTTCSASIQGTDPFSAGNNFPNDTTGSCTVLMSDISSITADLVDVCSYPSNEPNSDPSDCIVATNAQTGKLEIVKNLVPGDDSGLFNLLIDNAVLASNIGNNGTTTEQIVLASAGTGTFHTFSESAGTGTNLGDYTTTVECRDGNGVGSVVSTTGSFPWTVNVVKDDDIVCTVTNTRVNNASITIVKDSFPDDPQDFSFTTTGTGLSNFSLDDDVDGTLLNTKIFNNLSSGTYSVAETLVPEWTQTSAVCSDGSTVSAISLQAGENVTCTFVNTKKGHIVIDKVTYPLGDQQSFIFTTTGTGYFGFNLTDVSTPNDQELIPGNYSVSEASETGWDSDGGVCVSSIDDTETVGNLELDPAETITCTFTNTKRGKIILEKQTNPDQASGSFTFTGGVAGTISDGGQIIIENVIPGQYLSTENDPTPSFDLTNISCDDTTNGGQASFGNVGARTITFNVDPGETVKCVVTNTQRGSIFGYKYEDLNGDGQSGDWVPVQNWIIELWQGQIKIGETSTLANGYFSFTNLIQGAYTLVEQMLSGWTNVSSSLLNVTLDAGEDDGPNNFINTRYGTITIEKQTLPNSDSQFFNFTGDVAGPIANGGTITITDKEPGIYTSTEVLPVGWDLTSIVCDDVNSTGDINTGVATFRVESGENVKCTFTNTKRAHIIIEKNSIPDGSQVFTFNNNFGNGNPNTFDLVDDNTLGLPNYDAEVLPGTYIVSENSISGWQQESAVCDNGETIGSIDVSAGETVTCTFTNEKLASITLVKNTDGGDDSFDFDATGEGLPSDIDLTTVSGTASQTFINLDPDNTYTLLENVPIGWDLLSAVCDNDDSVSNITPDAGEEIICTFVNQKDANIIVTKQTIPDGSQQNFEFSTNYGSNFSLADGDSSNSGDLNPGSYYVTELGVQDWDLTEAVCIVNGDSQNSFDPRGDEFYLNAGDTIECTFTNSRKPTINVIKHVINDNGGNSIASDFVINVTGVNPDNTSFAGSESGTVVTLDPGEYGVDEDYFAGYTKSLSVDCSETVSFGDSKTCTITNDDEPGTLIVKKIIDGGSNVYEDFGFRVNGDKTVYFESDGQNDLTVNAGYYTVIEDSADGYTTTYDNCSEVFVPNGGNQTCTITNTRDQGEIIIKKIIDEDGDLGTSIDQTLGTDWEIDFDGEIKYTDSNGELKSGKIDTGTNVVSETQQDGYDFITSSCSDGSTVDNIVLSKDELITCTFYNTPNGTIHGYKWNDINGNGTDLFEQEELLGNWTINLFAWNDEDQNYTDLIKTTTTDNNAGSDFGWYWFTHIFPGTYKVCEVNQDGWSQTYPDEDGCHLVTLPDLNPPVYNFGNMEDNPEIVITKSNDKSNGANIGDNVTYTLIIENTGNLYLNNLEVKDAIPGGFTYVAGTSYLNNALISDPTITGGLLTWNVGDIAQEEKVTLTYQLKIGDTIFKNSTYINFATCRAFYGGFRDEETLFRVTLFEQSEIECNIADSSVSIGTSNSYGGNLFGQVLGASTELPATGNPTWLLALAMLGLTGGLLLKRKYAK
ncbi:hypothetical protein A2616_01265 [Candidatus Woesebacteria bacterium RIFOXYD1_FULL_33_11]|nr:MAG: hypothetical protein A2616_01265 [Candidatus Woesebacteria bacterium RIFOXYD1_FULL_33_11]